MEWSGVARGDGLRVMCRPTASHRAGAVSCAACYTACPLHALLPRCEN